MPLFEAPVKSMGPSEISTIASHAWYICIIVTDSAAEVNFFFLFNPINTNLFSYNTRSHRDHPEYFWSQSVCNGLKLKEYTHSKSRSDPWSDVSSSARRRLAAPVTFMWESRDSHWSLELSSTVDLEESKSNQRCRVIPLEPIRECLYMECTVGRSVPFVNNNVKPSWEGNGSKIQFNFTICLLIILLEGVCLQLKNKL